MLGLEQTLSLDSQQCQTNSTTMTRPLYTIRLRNARWLRITVELLDQQVIPNVDTTGYKRLRWVTTDKQEAEEMADILRKLELFGEPKIIKLTRKEPIPDENCRHHYYP